MLLARCYLNPPKLVNPLKTLHNFLGGRRKSKIFSKISPFLAFFWQHLKVFPQGLFSPGDLLGHALKAASLTLGGFLLLATWRAPEKKGKTPPKWVRKRTKPEVLQKNGVGSPGVVSGFHQHW